jgi:hypothetical protein
MSGNGLGPWRSIFMYILNLSFCVEKQFPFPLSTAELLGEYCYNRKQEANMFLSVITYMYIGASIIVYKQVIRG